MNRLQRPALPFPAHQDPRREFQNGISHTQTVDRNSKVRPCQNSSGYKKQRQKHTQGPYETHILITKWGYLGETKKFVEHQLSPNRAPAAFPFHFPGTSSLLLASPGRNERMKKVHDQLS
eukprot:Trichotokara_eunicae@DN8590_c0_g1_i1.p1